MFFFCNSCESQYTGIFVFCMPALIVARIVFSPQERTSNHPFLKFPERKKTTSILDHKGRW